MKTRRRSRSSEDNSGRRGKKGRRFKGQQGIDGVNIPIPSVLGISLSFELITTAGDRTDVVEVLGLAPLPFLGIRGARKPQVAQLVVYIVVARIGLGGDLYS